MKELEPVCAVRAETPLERIERQNRERKEKRERELAAGEVRHPYIDLDQNRAEPSREAVSQIPHRYPQG